MLKFKNCKYACTLANITIKAVNKQNEAGKKEFLEIEFNWISFLKSRCFVNISDHFNTINFYYLWHMRTLTFKIPDTFDMDEKEVAMHIASKLYEHGKLSL